MRLSSKTEYALLALTYLARLQTGELAHAKEISVAQNIPIKFLQQILHALTRARLTTSLKGADGGYALRRPPQEVNLAEIVRLFDGPLAPSRSVSRFFHEETPIIKERKITRVLREVRDLVAQKLESTTLADIV